MRPSMFAVGLLSLSAACSSAPVATTPAPSPSFSPSLPPVSDAGPAPTYTQLFDDYFARGKAGHCATAGCHANPGHNQWLCGTTKDSCYAGMVQVGLIDTAHPQESSIADPSLSPLVWVNPSGGNMPFDAQGTRNDTARDAILSWVAAGAKND